MDPNEALDGMRMLVNQFRDEPIEDIAAHAEAMADTFTALDEWLSRQGFLPAAWAIPGERG
jgi:hypothetical protein